MRRNPLKGGKDLRMKKNKSSIFLRYEFSDESGLPEGGDIFRLSSMSKVQEMTAEIIKVANSDGVTVNLTIGGETPFYGFLKNVGVSRQDAEKELVDHDFGADQTEKKSTAKSKVKAKAEPKSKSKSKSKKKK